MATWDTVRVVRVVDEPRRRGFAYGTLPEHPLRGDEEFFLRRYLRVLLE